MQGAHDDMVVTIEDRRADGAASGPRRVPTGIRLQDALAAVDADLAWSDSAVTVNGRSVSRLTPLLAGDRIVIARPPAAEES